jgi:hypothetical protein
MFSLILILFENVSYPSPPPTFLFHYFNPLNAKLNPIRHLLALAGAHHFVDVSSIRFDLKFCHSKAVHVLRNTLTIHGNPLVCLHCICATVPGLSSVAPVQNDTQQFLSTTQQPAPPSVPRSHIIVQASRSHSDTHTVSRTPLYEWSARDRDVYPKTRNTHRQRERQTCPRQDSNPQFPQLSRQRPTD